MELGGKLHFGFRAHTIFFGGVAELSLRAVTRNTCYG